MAKNEFQFIYQVVYSFSKELNKTQKQWNNFTFSWTNSFEFECEKIITRFHKYLIAL